MNQEYQEYREYLKSNHWKELRKEAFGKFGRICMACCNSPATSVHHLRYLSLYNVTVEDVRPVCTRCHRKVHRIMKSIKIRRKHQNYFDRWLASIKKIQKSTVRFKKKLARYEDTPRVPEDWSI